MSQKMYLEKKLDKFSMSNIKHFLTQHYNKLLTLFYDTISYANFVDFVMYVMVCICDIKHVF